MSHTYVPANCCFCYLWSISKTNVEVLTQLKCVFCLKNHGFNSEARRGNYYTFYIEVTGALVFTTPLLNHLSPDWLSFINWRFKEQGVGLNVHIRDIHSQWFTHSKSINTSLSIWSSLLTTGSQGLRLHALTSLLEALAMFNMSIWHWNMFPFTHLVLFQAPNLPVLKKHPSVLCVLAWHRLSTRGHSATLSSLDSGNPSYPLFLRMRTSRN